MIMERMMEMILGYNRNDWEQFQIKNPVEIVLPKKTSNILIAGKSGSGKSLSARWYLWQLLHNREITMKITPMNSIVILPDKANIFLFFT